MLHIFHKWKIVYKDGAKEVQECAKCQKRRSSAYDMCYGETIWVDGDWWSYLAD